MIKPFLTTTQVAKICGSVAPRTIAKWADAGLMKCHRLPNITRKQAGGGDRRFLLADVLAFCERQGIPPQGLASQEVVAADEPAEGEVPQ